MPTDPEIENLQVETAQNGNMENTQNEQTENLKNVEKIQNGHEENEPKKPLENEPKLEGQNSEAKLEEKKSVEEEQNGLEQHNKQDIPTVSITTPIIEYVAKSPIESAPEPLVESVPEPTVESVPEPTIKSVPQPVVEIVDEPVAEPSDNQLESPVSAQNGGPKKVSMLTSLDADTIKAAYEDVRSDNTETEWAVFKFEGPQIVCSATGSQFQKFRDQFTENDRAFGYIRIQTGDEMSKRQKFLFITWVGPSVSVIKRAKMSTDKAVIKNIISNFAVELQLENEAEFDLKHFVQELNKAGGANYGTGIRDV